MLGLGLGLNKGVPLALYKILARTCGLLSYANKVDSGIMYDKLGQTRDAVLAKKLVGDGSMEIRFATLANESFTYLDATTLTVENGSFDVSEDFLVPTNGIAELYYLDYVLDIPGLSSDIIQLVNLDDSSDFIQGTLMLPSATPTSFTDNVVSIEDMYGYTIADGSQYRDSALTQQYLVGAIIPCDKRGISFSYISDGAGGSLQPRADYVGRVGIYYRIVDGVVDLLTETYTVNTGASYISNISEVIVNSDGVSTYRQTTISVNSDNTLKTIKFKSSNLTGADAPRIAIRELDGTLIKVVDSLIDDVFVSDTFTPSQGGFKLEFYANLGTAEISSKKYYDFILFDGTVEPTSQALVVGNSVILNDTYGDVTTTDNNEVLWDKTNLVNKVVPVENINYHNQFFINADETRISYYEAPLTEPCLTRALSLMKL